MAMPHRIQHRQASLLAIGSTCVWIALGGCSGDEVTPPVGPENPDTVVDSIWASPSERTIGVLGAQFPVGAAALGEDSTILYGSTKNPGRFSWSSSAPDVATLGTFHHTPTGNELPLVKGVSEGTATITATSQGVTGSMTVSVRDRARLAWSVPIPVGSIGAGNVMAADGTIYVGTNDPPANRSIWYAISPQGGIRWTLGLPLTGRTIPAIGDDGTLYLGSQSSEGSAGRLIAVDPGGSVRWMLEEIDEIRSSPALGPDGTIYVAGGRHVYAVDPQGELRWVYENDDRTFTYSSPAVARDGTIYVGGTDHLLYAINPDGSLRWTFSTGDLIQGSPSIGTDGTIYVSSLDGRLYAVGPDGSERWRTAELDWRGVKSSPSIGPDGTIYVIADGVTAIDPGGSIRWNFPLSRSGATPILGAGGTVYIAGNGRLSRGVFALDSQGKLLWDYPAEDAGGSPIIGLDGTIIAAAGDDLIAIVEHSSTNGGYEGAPWPTVRGDRANSGRAGG